MPTQLLRAENEMGPNSMLALAILSFCSASVQFVLLERAKGSLSERSHAHLEDEELPSVSVVKPVCGEDINTYDYGCHAPGTRDSILDHNSEEKENLLGDLAERLALCLLRPGSLPDFRGGAWSSQSSPTKNQNPQGRYTYD